MRPTNELVYHESEWPHGLRCADCDHLFEEGERYSERLTGMAENPYGDSAIPGDMAAAVVLITCVPCGLGVRS